MGMEMFNGIPYGGIDPDGIHWSDAKTSVKKNLLPNNAVSLTINGITFTVNSDGSVTANGTATANAYYLFNELPLELENIEYALNGCPSGGSSQSYELQIRSNESDPSQWQMAIDHGNGISFIASSARKYLVFLGVLDGQTVSNLIFKPMIRLASIGDDTYVPYLPDNTELLSYKDNAILGTKNLLPNNGKNQTIGGITFTKNADGSITANGTQDGSSTGAYYHINDYFYGEGNYIINGCPSGGASNKYMLYVHDYDTGSIVVNGTDVGNGASITLIAGHRYIIVIKIGLGLTVSNLIFKPMIRLATDTDDTYVPYAKTNRELTSSTKATTLAVDLTNWTQDTTSQSGSTLYKKQISLNYVSVDCPNVDIGCASGSVLPTTAEQEAYNLIQYVTVDDTVPCLYLYASDIPTTAFYINVIGVD